MTGPANHAEVAWQNYLLTTGSSAQSIPCEWCITMLFYAALHGASHALYGPKWASEDNHQDREKKLLQERPDLFPAYKTLAKLSWVARYEPWRHPMSAEDEKEARRLVLEVLIGGAVPCHLSRHRRRSMKLDK
jgi:hypothetical protein